MPIARIDEILSGEFVAGLTELPLAEVRSRRDSCQEAADELSYLRRMVQGRLDIVHAELDRRAGGAPGDLHELVEQLKRGEILGEGTRAQGLGRLPHSLAAAETDGWISRELDSVADVATMSSLPDLPEQRVRELASALETLERRVSEQRGVLHERTNLLQEELVRRYKSGEATVDNLLTS